MIHTDTPFPHPGSIAEHEGQRCRILQAIGTRGEVALVSIFDGNRQKRVPFAELKDPAQHDVQEQALLAGLGDADTRRALWLARHLRGANEADLTAIDGAMRLAAAAGQVAIFTDRAHIARILRKLDWQRTAPGRYVRAAMARAA